MNEAERPQENPQYAYAAGHPLPGQNPYYPPSGTYPAPYETPIYNTQPPPEAEPPKKTRRVGTITMGACLVAVGVILILAIFLPAMDVLYIARFAPLVLVLLGAEILIAHIRHRDDKLRYDILSVVLCILLIGFSLFAAAVPVVYQRAVETQRAQRRLAVELEDRSYALFDGMDEAKFWTVDWSVSLNEADDARNLSVEDLKSHQYVHMNLYMDGEFADAEAFAKACQGAAKKLADVAPHITSAYFDSSGRAAYYAGDRHFTLDIEGRRMADYSAADLAKRVHTEYWLEEDGYYVSEWEYQDRLAHPEKYGYDPDEGQILPDEDWAEEDWAEDEPPDEIDPLSATPGALLKNGLVDGEVYPAA